MERLSRFGRKRRSLIFLNRMLRAARWIILACLLLGIGGLVFVSAVSAQQWKTQFQELFAEYVHDGRLDVGQWNILILPPGLISSGGFSYFPISKNYDVRLENPAFHFKLNLFGQSGDDQELSLSHARIVLGKRAAPGPIPAGIFSTLPDDEQSDTSIKIDLFDSEIYLAKSVLPEKIFAPEGLLLKISHAALIYRKGLLNGSGDGFLFVPQAQSGNLPISFSFQEQPGGNNEYSFELQSTHASARGVLYYGKKDPDWKVEFDTADFGRICPYLLPSGCTAFPYFLKATGTTTADLEWNRCFTNFIYNISLPVRERVLKSVDFGGIGSADYIRSTNFVPDLRLRGDGLLGVGLFTGTIDLNDLRMKGNFDLKIPHLNEYNGFFPGNSGLPPGEAQLNAAVDILWKDLAKSSADGEFKFGGYRMTAVDQGKGLMKFLKITGEGADDDEIVFPQAQSIGLEIKGGSGGHFTLRNGKLYYANFSIYTDTMNAFLKGSLDIVFNRYDTYLKFQGLRQVDRLLGYIPFFGIILDTRNESILNLNFHITGPLDAPTISPVYRIPEIDTGGSL